MKSHFVFVDDDCAMQFVDGDPWLSPLVAVASWEEESSATFVQPSSLLLWLTAAVMWLNQKLLQ